MACVVCMRARCVYAIVYAMPVDPRALLFHLFLSSLLPLLPLCRGSKQVIEFLKVNFSRTAYGPKDKPLLRVSYLHFHVNLPRSLFAFFVSKSLTALPLLNYCDISDHDDYEPCHRIKSYSLEE